MRHLVMAAGLLVAVGCGGSAPLEPIDELEVNRTLWLSSRPVVYSYAIERLCFCGAEARGPVRVQVVSALATERRYVETGEPVSAAFETYFPTVDGLFDVLRDALDRDAFEVRVTYDPVSGVPVDVWIDYLQHAIDEELGFRVTESVTDTAGGP